MLPTMMTKAIHGDSSTNNKKNIEDVDEVCMNGYPWPPRCYICGFCKREFKSAQALGGHMNVHRKDRARLRSSPLPSDFISHYTTQSNILNNLNLKSNPNPNPNPNPIFVPSSTPLSPPSHPFTSVPLRQQLPSWLSSQPSHSPPPTFSMSSATNCYSESMKWLVGGGLSAPSDSVKLKSSLDAKAQEKDGCMRLDLEIGVLGSNSNNSIDLELRLGY